MTMDLKEFKKNVLVHGSDLGNWPEQIRETGQKALDGAAELRALLADEERFEGVLKTRRYEEPGEDLAERIISASVEKGKAPSTRNGFFSELLQEFWLPKPALTAVFVSLFFALIIGFTVGFLNSSSYVSAEQDETNLQNLLYYEGEVL
jgi:hypothetical protein